MDRGLYVAMSGAKQVMLAQGRSAHNLANVNTVGFRADFHMFNSVPVEGPGHESRINALVGESGTDFSGGIVRQTGKALDVLIRNEGWIAVQTADEAEAYTRAGNLRIDNVGRLTTGDGHPVLGDAGPISIAPYEQLHIGGDGSISIVPLGQSAETIAVVDRIRLVNPALDNLEKREDGLLHARDGQPVEPDAAVTIESGALELSNVNAVREMIDMIGLARQWEMHVRMMSTVDENSASVARMMQLS